MAAIVIHSDNHRIETAMSYGKVKARSPMQIGSMLTGIVAANLALNVALFAYVMNQTPGTSWLSRVVFALPFGQVFLLGYWLGLGDGRWYSRLVIALPLAMSVGYSIGIGATLSHATGRHDFVAQSHVMVFFFIALLLAVFVLTLPIRRFRGWRLTWNRSAAAPPLTRQFQIGDLLLWMIPIGGVLGTWRFLLTLDSTMAQGIGQFSLNLTGFAVVSWLAMMAVFKQQRRMMALFVLATLLVGVAFAIVEWIRLVQLVSTGLPWTTMRVVLEALSELTTFVATAILVLVNCLALRALGCRLVRPGDQLRSNELAPLSAKA